MSSIDSLLKETGYMDFLNRISKINKDTPDYNKTLSRELLDYGNQITDYIVKQPLERVVCILDFFNNFGTSVFNVLINKKVDKILDALLILEKLDGINPIDIRESVDKVIEKKESYIFWKGVRENNGSYEQEQKNSEKKYRILNEYLNTKNSFLVEVDFSKNINKFAENLPKVSEIIFSNTKQGAIPPRADLINNLFLNCNIDLEHLNTIYQEVLLKDKNLKSFDYSTLCSSNELVKNIKGLYKKVGSNYFELIEDKIKKQEIEELESTFKAIIKNNLFEEFFGKINPYMKKNRYVEKYFQGKEYYKKYASKNEKINPNMIVQKILNGDTNISSNILIIVSKTKPFLDNYNLILDKYMKSNDESYQSNLLIPLILGLIEKQKQRYKVDFKTVFTSEVINNKVFGSFDKEKEELYINPSVLERYVDKKDALLSAVLTIFHETRHAYQNKVILESKDISYDNLQMAIDRMLSKNSVLTSYNNNNYMHLSDERDARDVAYVDTLTFFEKYPETREKLRPEDKSNYVLSDFMRKETYIFVEKYMGIIDLFLIEVNGLLDECKDDIELKKEIVRRTRQYPVIDEFFDFNKNTYHFSPKSKDYFEKKLHKLERMPKSIKNREAIYSIKTFLYALKVSKYLSEKEDNDFDFNDGYNKEIVEEVIENVGQRPSR